MSFRTELKVPPDSAFGSLVERFAADAAERAELSAARAHGLVLAAREGFGAIVTEALAEGREPIRIVAACTPAYLELALFERGLPMDDALARRDPRWSELCSGVDVVHWRCHGAAGSELRLIVNRAHAAEDAAAAAIPAEEDVPLAPAQEYTIRRFVPGDAIGVARAFYLTYGYAYDLAAVYAPERLVELNEQGSYISIVALASDGEVVGHCALARDHAAPIADLAGAIVLPAHRGRNLLNRMLDRAEAEAAALGLAGYYSEPVTDHPRTQLSSESFGEKACGVTLGEAPRSFVARHMELSTTTQRQSCMLYVKPLRPREPRAIYAPPRHRSIVASIYEQLGLPVTFSGGAPANGRGLFHTGITRLDRIATVDVEAVGTETAELVYQAVEDLRATQRLGAVYASLPLEDAGTPALCEALESRGFFFSGVGPWMLDGKDALRLQMPLTPIDLSAIVVIGEFGKILFDYVASERNRCAGDRG
ncbi:MAG TPA: GNAT family N-acetyltransferase [Candidatus Binatia bacterium]|nr:GNAT family N-acetyltransferase [Candidatus Binatia bacterium]